MNLKTLSDFARIYFTGKDERKRGEAMKVSKFLVLLGNLNNRGKARTRAAERDAETPSAWLLLLSRGLSDVHDKYKVS